MDINSYSSYFFVGIAGTGMSAIAQYLNGIGKQVSGSDRLFSTTEKMLSQTQFEAQGISCYFQDGSGISNQTDVVIVSTAIEESNIEYQKALKLNIPIVKRSELLAAISDSIKTIAVGGTSGKSTTTAMIFHILEKCGKSPSLITGAGLSDLQDKGLPGNAWNGKGEWLVIESDESDGSIVNYHPEIALLLNIDRDHKEFEELIDLFSTFKSHTKSTFIVNQDFELTRKLSQDIKNDFGTQNNAGITGSNFEQKGFSINFQIDGKNCVVPLIGRHNMENALAAIAAAKAVGISLNDAINALADFKGIYRRAQLVGSRKDTNQYVIDDFAHNPAEVASAIRACQTIALKVIAYFQPHGFGPLSFMHKELGEMVAKTLRNEDIFLIGDVYYAGGTVDKNISPVIVSDAINETGKNAKFVGNKQQALKAILEELNNNTVILTMGARDPKLDVFAKEIFEAL